MWASPQKSVCGGGGGRRDRPTQWRQLAQFIFIAARWPSTQRQKSKQQTSKQAWKTEELGKISVILIHLLAIYLVTRHNTPHSTRAHVKLARPEY
jgi:hypothetical protein